MCVLGGAAEAQRGKPSCPRLHSPAHGLSPLPHTLSIFPVSGTVLGMGHINELNKNPCPNGDGMGRGQWGQKATCIRETILIVKRIQESERSH